jgi:hypothetical protein
MQRFPFEYTVFTGMSKEQVPAVITSIRMLRSVLGSNLCWLLAFYYSPHTGIVLLKRVMTALS